MTDSRAGADFPRVGPRRTTVLPQRVINKNNKKRTDGDMNINKTHGSIPTIPGLAEPLVAFFASYARANQRVLDGDFDGAAEAVADAHTLAQGLDARCVRDIRLLGLAKTGQQAGQETGRLSQQLAAVFGVPVDRAFAVLTGFSDDQ